MNHKEVQQAIQEQLTEHEFRSIGNPVITELDYLHPVNTSNGFAGRHAAFDLNTGELTINDYGKWFLIRNIYFYDWEIAIIDLLQDLLFAHPQFFYVPNISVYGHLSEAEALIWMDESDKSQPKFLWAWSDYQIKSLADELYDNGKVKLTRIF